MTRNITFCIFENRKTGACKVIAVDACTVYRKKACSFYKSEEENVKSRERAYARLRKLPTVNQVAISAQYYDGKMPWKEERKE